MKYFAVFLIFSGSLILTDPVVNAQINPLRKIKVRTNKQIDKEIDKVFDDAFDKDKKQEEEKKQTTSPPQTNQNQNGQQQANPNSGSAEITNVNEKKDEKPELKWSKYDFVPGDKIIFEDNLMGEENGEFPSRWDLVRGNVEIAQLGDENVIVFRAGSPRIIPYLKNPEKDYLPEIFTIEFDLYCGVGTFEVILYDVKNQKSGSPSGWTSFKITHNEMGWANTVSKLAEESLPKMRWVHIAIAYTSGKLKGYIDETRLVNIPRIDFDPKGVTLYTYIFGTLNEGHYYVKNFRIAEGGVKYYDRMIQDGKIITNGIRFDVGKASLKPESMGIINEIYDLMNENPDLKFSVEGHTDNTGDESSNLTLSAARAESVMNKLIDMGIQNTRLTSKGFGESKPLSDNGSPEERANNRRVEFVKINKN